MTLRMGGIVGGDRQRPGAHERQAPNGFQPRSAAFGPNGQLYVCGSRTVGSGTAPVLAQVDRRTGAWTDITETLHASGVNTSTIAGVDAGALVLAGGAAAVYSFRISPN